jgi:alpha-ribazole phosphatase
VWGHLCVIPGVFANLPDWPEQGKDDVIVALLRHPKPLIENGICYGRLDAPLHPQAEAELASMRHALAGFPASTLWSSPALRCRLSIPALATGLAPYVDDRLQELDFGDWEGMAWDDVPRHLLDVWATDPWSFAPPGGESGSALVARVTSFHADLVQDGRDCIVLSHGGPLRLLLALLEGKPPDLLAPAPSIGSVTFVGSARSAPTLR